jgi:hypothetical protein
MLPATPLYDSLHTNLPHPIMAYRGFPFPPETPLYPPASIVLAYLQSYASAHNLYPHIRLNTTVESAVRVNGKWHVTFSSPSGSSTLERHRQSHRGKWALLAAVHPLSPGARKLEGRYTVLPLDLLPFPVHAR